MKFFFRFPVWSLLVNHLTFLTFVLTGSLYAQASMYSFKAYKMGTEFEIVVNTVDTFSLNAAVSAAWQSIDQINDVFSDYTTNSELYHVQHQHGSPVEISPTFRDLLMMSLKYSQCSKGAFDVTIGTLSRIWRRAIRMHELPSRVKIDTALQYVGYQKIKLKGNTLMIPDGVLLDFGAIAKGYAVDQAIAVLRSRGYKSIMVDGGGDLYMGAAPTGSPGWKVLLSIQRKDLSWIDTTYTLVDRAIVTSGDRYKSIHDSTGHIYSHIVDPRTGMGLAGPHQTTVIAATATHADALATTISILPLHKIKRFKRKWHRAFPGENDRWTFFKSRL